jgi:hypothetical protein
MNIVKVIGVVDEKHQLSALVPADIPAGPVEIIVLLPADEDEAGRAWSAGIARAWAAELEAPREDVYTLEDGEPVDGAR